MSKPENNTPDLAHQYQERLLLSLAEEIAKDIIPLDTILTNHKVTTGEFARIAGLRMFQMLLDEATAVWQSTNNVQARIKAKALAQVEQALPEMFKRLHDPRELLSAKNEVFKNLMRLAELGNAKEAGGTGERVSIVVNMGDGTVQARTVGLPTPVIDHEEAMVVEGMAEPPTGPEDFGMPSAAAVAAHAIMAPPEEAPEPLTEEGLKARIRELRERAALPGSGAEPLPDPSDGPEVAEHDLTPERILMTARQEPPLEATFPHMFRVGVPRKR